MILIEYKNVLYFIPPFLFDHMYPPTTVDDWSQQLLDLTYYWKCRTSNAFHIFDFLVYINELLLICRMRLNFYMFQFQALFDNVVVEKKGKGWDPKQGNM